METPACDAARGVACLQQRAERGCNSGGAAGGRSGLRVNHAQDGRIAPEVGTRLRTHTHELALIYARTNTHTARDMHTHARDVRADSLTAHPHAVRASDDRACVRACARACVRVCVVRARGRARA